MCHEYNWPATVNLVKFDDKTTELRQWEAIPRTVTSEHTLEKARNAESAVTKDNLNNGGYTARLRGLFVRSNIELAVPYLFQGRRGRQILYLWQEQACWEQWCLVVLA